MANGNGSNGSNGHGGLGVKVGQALEKTDEKVRGSQAWTAIFRPGLGVPPRLHRQPPQPLLRDHEQRAVPPSPGEGEAARGEGVVHALPRRALLLPVHPAHRHRHLPDVLLPADGGRRVADRATLETAVTFGSLVRNMHRWAAHLMVLTVFLHMSRVFYHGAYKAPREFNWVIGVDAAHAHPAALVHRLPAARGTSWRSGPSPSART